MKFGYPILLATLLLVAVQNANAAGATFDVVFTDSTYRVTNTDTFSDLLSQHNAASVISSTSITAMQGIDTLLYAGNISGDYSVLMSTTLDIKTAGSYEFQVGTDWGRGGGVALFDTDSGSLLQETVDHTDIWWGYNWGHSDVISTTYNLTESKYTIMWLGFEGCCAGSSTVRFAFDGGAYSTLDMTNIAPYVVPIPASSYLFASSLVGLIGLNRTRKDRNRTAS